MPDFYYIASPGFNDNQLQKISDVEKMLDGFRLDYFSPFKEGDKLDMKNPDTDLVKLNIKCIFDKNIDNINKASHLIAIVDDFDKGTAFEIGHFAKKCDPVTLSSRLLLLGKKAEEVSEELNKIIYAKSNSNKFDLDNKDLATYLRLGYMYDTCKIYTYSKERLSSNVMTACAVTFHYQADLYKDTDHYYDTFEKFVAAQTGELNLLGTKFNYQLDAVRLSSSVE